MWVGSYFAKLWPWIVRRRAAAPNPTDCRAVLSAPLFLSLTHAAQDWILARSPNRGDRTLPQKT